VRLVGIIPDLSGLTSLTHIDFQFHKLTGFDTFSKFPAAVEMINLEFNQLTGTIPDSIGDYPLLQELYLQKNDLSGRIPATIANLVSLNALDLSNNDLSGLIPTSLNNLLDLLYCNLSGNNGEFRNEEKNGLCRDKSLTTCSDERIPGTSNYNYL
jgi:LRR receptor-like serine/threonine-protein kinase FLS2